MYKGLLLVSLVLAFLHSTPASCANVRASATRSANRDEGQLEKEDILGLFDKISNDLNYLVVVLKNLPTTATSTTSMAVHATPSGSPGTTTTLPEGTTTTSGITTTTNTNEGNTTTTTSPEGNTTSPEESTTTTTSPEGNTASPAGNTTTTTSPEGNTTFPEESTTTTSSPESNTTSPEGNTTTTTSPEGNTTTTTSPEGNTTSPEGNTTTTTSPEGNTTSPEGNTTTTTSPEGNTTYPEGNTTTTTSPEGNTTYPEGNTTTTTSPEGNTTSPEGSTQPMHEGESGESDEAENAHEGEGGGESSEESMRTSPMYEHRRTFTSATDRTTESNVSDQHYRLRIPVLKKFPKSKRNRQHDRSRFRRAVREVPFTGFVDKSMSQYNSVDVQHNQHQLIPAKVLYPTKKESVTQKQRNSTDGDVHSGEDPIRGLEYILLTISSDLQDAVKEDAGSIEFLNLMDDEEQLRTLTETVEKLNTLISVHEKEHLSRLTNFTRMSLSMSQQIVQQRLSTIAEAGVMHAILGVTVSGCILLVVILVWTCYRHRRTPSNSNSPERNFASPATYSLSRPLSQSSRNPPSSRDSSEAPRAPEDGGPDPAMPLHHYPGGRPNERPI